MPESRVELPGSLGWRGLVEVLARLGFRASREELRQIEMRRGDIYAVVRLYDRESQLVKDFRLHQRVGGSRRRVETSSELIRLKEELRIALKERERVDGLWEEGGEEALEEYERYTYCCPYYQACPSFSEGSSLCTYSLADRSVCRGYTQFEAARRTRGVVGG